MTTSNGPIDYSAKAARSREVYGQIAPNSGKHLTGEAAEKDELLWDELATLHNEFVSANGGYTDGKWSELADEWEALGGRNNEETK